MIASLSALEFMLPWDFSPTVLVVTTLTVALFARGIRRMAPGTPAPRPAAFYSGVALIYCALQTRWDFYAGHMFFVHRLQHFALHDVGPFLLAFSAPARAIACGTPDTVRRRLRPLWTALRPLGRFIFDPLTATALFIGSLCLWVWPPMHFDAMISNWLYTLMNWSVVIGDLPFWWLILDPRPYPQARLGQGKRMLLVALVMGPMILVGAVIGLSTHDLYPVYEICGRFYPISPVTDQQLGGLIIWIPGSLLATFAAMIALRRAMYESEAREHARRSGERPVQAMSM